MATNYGEKQFLGTAQTVLTTGATIASTFFGAASSVYDNTSDAAYPYAPWARAVLSFQFTVAPTALTVIELWALPQDVDGTTDETDAPTSGTTTSGGARCLGGFVCAASTAAQVRSIAVSMLGIDKTLLYLRNGTGQTLNSGAVLKMTPLTIGPTV